MNLKLPAFLEAGEWKVYFKSSVGTDGFSQYGFRSIRFASNDVWHGAFGANYLGYVEVTPTTDTEKLCDNTFGEVGKNLKNAQLYSLGGKIAADGQASDGEWAEEDVIAENGGHKLYAKADEEYLYIMADLPHNSKAPVFNFHATKADGTPYWLYQQSNGFIYFNHDAELGHAGMLLKYSDDVFEFRIPLYMLQSESDSVFTEMSVNVQDSGDGWKSTGSIVTENYTIKSDFTLYNAYEKLTVKKGSSYEFRLETDAEISNVIWYVNGVQVAGNSTTLILTPVDNTDCVITAKITTVKGTVKELGLAEIKTV